MTVISISAPDSFIGRVDDLAEEAGYAGRSDLVRAALRDFMQQYQQERDGDGRVSATITLTYPEGAERDVADAKHAFTDIITSMMHSHTEERCLEVLIVDGAASRVRELTDRLRSGKSLRALNVFRVE